MSHGLSVSLPFHYHLCVNLIPMMPVVLGMGLGLTYGISLQISRQRRHLDKASVMRFWELLDK